MQLPVDINNVYELREWCTWSGGKDNVQAAIDHGHGDELFVKLENLIDEGVLDPADVNDFIWFDLPDKYPEFFEDEEDEEGDLVMLKEIHIPHLRSGG